MEKEWKRYGKKHLTILELKLDGMEWKWNGIRMENLWDKKSMGYCEEMERKRNGKKT